MKLIKALLLSLSSLLIVFLLNGCAGIGIEDVDAPGAQEEKEAITYTITFDTASEKAAVEPGNKTVTKGEAYGELPAPMREGYHFCGWYTAEGEEILSDSTVNLEEDQTLYARWEEIVIQHPINSTAALNTSVDFEVMASADDFSFQWEFSPAEEDAWYSYQGETSKTLSIIAYYYRNGYSYRCVLTDKKGITCVTLPVDLFVKNAIAQDPIDVAIDTDETAVFSVVARGIGLQYQWQFQKPDSSDWYDFLGQTSNKVCVDGYQYRNGYSYRCRVTDRNNNVYYSEPALLVLKPSIVSQPSDRLVNIDDDAVFSVMAEGANVKYQWEFKPSGEKQWHEMKSETGGRLSVYASASKNRYEYRCKVEDRYGFQVVSDPVSLKIRARIIEGPEDVIAANGEDVTFVVRATGIGLRFQWERRKAGEMLWREIDGATADSLDITCDDSSMAFEYRCKITDANDAVAISSGALILDGADYNCEHEYNVTNIQLVDDQYLITYACDLCDLTVQKAYGSLITFVDDDGTTQALQHWESIIGETGIRMDFALITGNIKDDDTFYASWDTIERLREMGAEFTSHTNAHIKINEVNTAALHQDLSLSSQILKEHGLYNGVIVYPFLRYDDASIDVVRQYFEYGICGDNTINGTSIDPYKIKRIGTQDPTRMIDRSFDGDTVACYPLKPIAALKSYVDQAAAEPSWLVFMTHAYSLKDCNYYFDSNDEQTLIGLINYIKSQNIAIVTVTEGVMSLH